ncbi:hypothetical protein NW767_015039, partial [Fusarium falciforme]
MPLLPVDAWVPADGANNCELEFKCGECSQSCASAGSLLTHYRQEHFKEGARRTWEEPVVDPQQNEIDRKYWIDVAAHRKRVCDKCQKAFNTSSDLATHKRNVHDKIRDHVCLKCSMAFSSKYDLNRHKKNIHDKIRNFVCADCGKRFVDQGSLNQHRGHMHGAGCTCEVCGEHMPSKKALAEHKNREHSPHLKH